MAKTSAKTSAKTEAKMVARFEAKMKTFMFSLSPAEFRIALRFTPPTFHEILIMAYQKARRAKGKRQ